MTRVLTVSLVALALGGCATTARVGPTEVVRYHLNQPIPPGSVAVEPAAATATISPEYRLYADSVARELGRLGYTPLPAGADAGGSQYVAAVGFQRTSKGTVRTPPKFSIGIGGGSFGGGGGVGGGLSTGIGSKTRDVLASELFVQLRRRSDGTIVWEGRAQNGGLSGEDTSQPVANADRLARALFKAFPGESGITTTVR